MDCCSDLESSNWKTDPGGVMSQQCYLANLNLRKSERSSKSEKKCRAKIVTVRRTRRVIYRYILDDSIDESNRNEKKGDTLIVDSKSQHTPRIVIKGKKQQKNISLTANSVPESNSDTPRIKKESHKRMSENYQLQSTPQSQNKCTDLQQGKDQFSSNDSFFSTVEKSQKTLNNFEKESRFKMENKFSSNSEPLESQKIKQSDDSRSKKQTRKRPKNNLMSDSHKIVRKKRKIVSGYSVTNNIKIEGEPVGGPENIKLEKNAFKSELEADTEKKLLDFHLPKVEVQKYGESNDELNFLMIPEKSLYNYSPKLVVAEEANDEQVQVTQGSGRSQNINISPKKKGTISNNVLTVSKVNEREEPSLEIIPGFEMPFDNHSLEQRIHSLTVEEQIQELFFPRKCMGETDHFVPVPNIEIEIETSEIIPMAGGVLQDNSPASNNNKRIINTSVLMDSQAIDHEEQETNNLGVSTHYLQSYNEDQHITDTSIAFKHTLEANNFEEHVVVDTMRTKEKSQEFHPTKQNVELEHNCLSRPLVDMEVRTNKSLEKISTLHKSRDTYILDCNDGAEMFTKAQRITKDILELNNDEQKTTDSSGISIHYLHHNTDQCQNDNSRIPEHTQESDTNEHPISTDTPEKVKHFVELPDPAQQTLKHFEHSFESNNDEDIITKGTLGTTKHSLVTNNNKEQQTIKEKLKRLKYSPDLNTDRRLKGKDDLIIKKHPIELTDDEQQNVRDTVIILNRSLEPELINPEHQAKYGTIKRLKYSMRPKNDGCQIQKESLKISEYSLHNIDEGHLRRDSLGIIKHALLSPEHKQHNTRDTFSIQGHSVDHRNNEQLINTDALRKTEHCLELKNYECHTTKQVLKIAELEADNEQRGRLRRTEKTLVPTNDAQQIKKHPLEPYNDEQHRIRDNFRLSRHSLEYGTNEQQIKADTRKITEYPVEPKNHECHTTKSILKKAKLEADNEHSESLQRTKYCVVPNNDEQQIIEHSLESRINEQHKRRRKKNNELQIKPNTDKFHITNEILRIVEPEADNEQRETLRRTEKSVVPINDEQQITKHPLEPYNDEQHRTRDYFRLSGHSLEHGINDPQIKADTQIITEYSLDSKYDECHATKHILKIAELEADNENSQSLQRTEHCVIPNNDEQQINEHSLQPFNNEQHRTTDNFRLSGHSLEHGINDPQIKGDTHIVTEYSLDPENVECDSTKHILKIAEPEADKEHRESSQRTEHCVVSINDEQQITEHSLESFNNEQHRTRDNFRLSRHSLEYGTNDLQIKADSPKLTEYSLDPENDECHTTKHILKIAEQEADNENSQSLQITEHCVIPNNDEQQINEHSLEPFNNEQHRTRDNSRLSRHSLEYGTNDLQIKADSHKKTEYSLDPENDECHTTNHILKIAEPEVDNEQSLRRTEHSVVPINDEHQIAEDSVEPYSDEQHREGDTLRISEQYLEGEKDEHHTERDALRMTEHFIEANSDQGQQGQITKDILRIPKLTSFYINRDNITATEHSMETNYDEQQRTMDTLKIQSPQDRNDEQHIEEDSLRISEYSLKPNKDGYSLDTDDDEQQIKNDSLRTTEHFVRLYHDEPPITKHILRISNYSLEHHNDKVLIEKDTVERIKHSPKLNNDEWQVTRESLEISKHSIEHNDEHTLRFTERSMRPNNDEWQITEEPLKISKHSMGTDSEEEQILKHNLRSSEHSKKQQIIKETLKTATFRESKHAQEPCNTEEHKAIDDMRNKHSREIILHYGQADDDEQHLITDKLRISRNSAGSNVAEQEITNYASRISQHFLEPNSNEEVVTNYANQLHNISSPEDRIEDSFLPELHLEVEVEINDGTEIASKMDKSVDNYSMKLYSHEEEISNDTSAPSKDLFPEQNNEVQYNFSPKSISEMESEKSLPKEKRIEKSRGKELRSRTRKVRTKSKEQLQSNVKSALRYKEDESEELSPIEVIHYKPMNYFQRQYCTFCKVGYMNRIVLEKHMYQCKLNPKNIKMEPPRIFYCKICNFGITDEVFFRQHEEKCQNEVICGTKNSCSNPPICGTASKSRRRRSAIGRHKCPNCEYTSDNIGHMSVHRRIHDKIPLCVCDVCKKGFTRLDALKVHMFRHIDVAKNVLEVEKVKVWNGNASKSTLEVNIKNKDFTIVKYQCSKCKYAAPLADSMEKHINSMHLNLSNFKCHLCSFSTKVKTNLNQHLNWHSKEKTYKCSYCSYETINKTYIKHHENQVHLKTVSFKCGLCDFVAYRKENLKTHVHSIHLKMKKYPCKKCDYFSYVQSNLIAHVKSIHEGIKRKYKRT